MAFADVALLATDRDELTSRMVVVKQPVGAIVERLETELAMSLLKPLNDLLWRGN
tara:strand:- start:229 stop:393 length:165 start_codon:yes stop_codon:yes gene_type:complete